MHISRSFIYAAEAIARLARSGGTLNATQLADSAGISSRFLLHVLRLLVEAGLLRSRKGPAGGYTLARPSTEITMLDILEAVEGPLRISAIEEGRFESETAELLEQVTEAMRQRWASVTLESLAAAEEGEYAQDALRQST